jgi:hypothetical protein
MSNPRRHEPTPGISKCDAFLPTNPAIWSQRPSSRHNSNKAPAHRLPKPVSHTTSADVCVSCQFPVLPNCITGGFYLKWGARVAQSEQRLGYGPNNRGLVPSRGNEIFSFHHRVQTGSGAHPSSYPMDAGGKAAGPSSCRSAPSSAEVKNAWMYTSTPRIMSSWRGV